ncbi:MAG: hypothetical protein M1491_06385 [Deltaproteobacteria bacterium]|nr:hypothetical protein [Deltaproteobacteria bacterium]MCL5277311.1 hypothetical protein [Deltaproteobacteria bacterium]
MNRLKLTDKIRTINSGLFVLLGIIIVIRSIRLSAGIHLWLPVLVGASFIGFGIYRLGFVLRYLRGRQ